VRSRVEAGRLHRVHESVFAVGHPLLTKKGRYMAAVLACGPRALLSHRKAADLWGVLPTAGAQIDVTCPPRTGRGRARIAVHRASNLAPADVTTVDGIPCTSLARTLVDLAGVVRPDSLERACEQAEILGLFDLRAVKEVLRRSRGRRGVARLRAVIADGRDAPAFTRSELERRFLALCRRLGLPTPAANVWIELPDDGLEVDFLWEDQRVVVETDGRRFHGSPWALRRDRLRERKLASAGYRVERFSWTEVVDEPEFVRERLSALMAQRV